MIWASTGQRHREAGGGPKELDWRKFWPYKGWKELSQKRPQTASDQWAPPGPAWASQRPLQTQVILKSASPGPAPASRWPLQQATCFGSAPAQLPPAFGPPKLSPAKLFRPTSCLLVACTGPALAGEQPLQAPLLPPRGLSRPSSRPTVASWGQVPACLPAARERPSSSLRVACLGPTRASGTLSRGVSPCLTLASLMLREVLPHAGLLRPSSCLWWPLQVQPLPVGGL
ncbi:putative uncharacterized protein FLJ46235 [Gorilla gorilla gorilla]|uniref:putative uncharacterized protein FLJ46235 n=1 Tax=Gorilla gorilla gorilla TaxID=9595 RepID=UPI002445D5EC|nr:putative uncharacterized protein FLJ46235 [Gorilla gorilla gorilla]